MPRGKPRAPCTRAQIAARDPIVVFPTMGKTDVALPLPERVIRVNPSHITARVMAEDGSLMKMKLLLGAVNRVRYGGMGRKNARGNQVCLTILV